MATPDIPEPRSMHVLRLVLAVVCVADIGLGLLILFVPRVLFRLFDVALPPDLLWFQLIGLMLIPGAVDGLVGYLNPGRYGSNLLVSACSRLATSGFLFVVNSVRDVPTILVVLAIGEGLVGLLGGYYVWRSRSPGSVKQSASAVGA